MRHDPIELALTRSASRRAALRRDAARHHGHHESVVLDEAFARFDRVDPPSLNINEFSDAHSMKQSFVADIANQLEGLDRQRERLAMLLASIETNSLAD